MPARRVLTASLDNALADSERNLLKRAGSLPKATNYISQEMLALAKVPAPEAANLSRERITVIRMDPTHPFNLPKDPRHKLAVEEMSGLYNAQFYENGEPVLKDE